MISIILILLIILKLIKGWERLLILLC
jgi:hypothetical protein